MLLILLLLIPLTGTLLLVADPETSMQICGVISGLAYLFNDLIHDPSAFYHYIEATDPLSEIQSGESVTFCDFDFNDDTGVHKLDERVLLENGVADAPQATARNNVIANGYDPAVSQQPYASNLANKMDELRDGDLQLPRGLLEADKNYVRTMSHHCWNNYNPNIHYQNSSTMRRFLRNLF
jgi:hypothetical protein